MTIAVLGDVGGQTQVYRDALSSLGINPDTCIIPDGLELIQVGDVVRFNHSLHLDSLGCAEISDRLLRNNPDRFYQLLGNHDLALLGGVLDPHWKIVDLPESRPIVEAWWHEGIVDLSVTLVPEDKDERDILISHAGVGYNYWNHLGGLDAQGTTKNLNALVSTPVQDYEIPGYLVTSDNNVNADSGWAIVGPEFHETWIGHEMPFNQIHGHACLMEWEGKKYWSDVSQEIRDTTVVNWDQRYTLTTRPDGSWVRSVDWILKNDPIVMEWPILMLEGYRIQR